MEDDKLMDFLSQLQHMFTSGEHDELQAFFTFPLVIYTVAGVSVIRTSAEFETRTKRYREALASLDVTSATMDLEHRDPPFNRRTKVTVRVTDFTSEGIAVTGSLIRYFLVADDGTYKVEMMEYLEAPLAVEDVEKIVH